MGHPENKYDLNDELPQPGLPGPEAGLLPPVLLQGGEPEDPALPQVSLQDYDFELLGPGQADPDPQGLAGLVEYLLPEVPEPGLADLAEPGLHVVLLELVQDELEPVPDLPGQLEHILAGVGGQAGLAGQAGQAGQAGLGGQAGLDGSVRAKNSRLLARPSI